MQQEIEKHKHIEEKLENSREEYSQLIEAMDEGLAILDKDGKITYVNKQFCDTLGLPREEILGHTPMDYVDKDNRSALERHMTKRARGGITTYVANLKGEGRTKLLGEDLAHVAAWQTGRINRQFCRRRQ